MIMWGRMGVERKETEIDSIPSQKGCWEGKALTLFSLLFKKKKKKVREITICLFMVKNKLPPNFQDNYPL